MTLDVGIELLDNVDQIRVPYGDFAFRSRRQRICRSEVAISPLGRPPAIRMDDQKLDDRLPFLGVEPYNDDRMGQPLKLTVP